MQDFAWPLFSYYLHEKIFVQPFVITTFRYHVIPTFLRLFLLGKWAVCTGCPGKEATFIFQSC